MFHNELKPRNFEVVYLQEICYARRQVGRSRRCVATFYQFDDIAIEFGGTDSIVMEKRDEARICNSGIKGHFSAIASTM